MKWPRAIGIVDLGILTLVAVALFLPPRPMYASPAIRAEADELSIAHAEALTLVRPEDGTAIAELSRRLGEAGFKDWATEVAIEGAARAPASPTRWRALLAASVAYVDRLDVVPALDYANRALAACETARAQNQMACPSWEEIRMRLYHQHLDAGVQSGIDPRQDPAGFRRAGESGLRQIRLKSSDGARAPTP